MPLFLYPAESERVFSLFPDENGWQEFEAFDFYSPTPHRLFSSLSGTVRGALPHINLRGAEKLFDSSLFENRKKLPH